MPAPNIVSATVTSVTYPPRSTAIDVNVSIHRRIYRQASKLNRAHQLKVDVTYDSTALTSEQVSVTVLVSATTLVGQLPDKRREVTVSVPLGTHPEPGGVPSFQAAVALIIAPKAGTERDDDEGDDDSVSEETYDNS